MKTVITAIVSIIIILLAGCPIITVHPFTISLEHPWNVLGASIIFSLFLAVLFKEFKRGFQTGYEVGLKEIIDFNAKYYQDKQSPKQ